jgi:hypothetical protein
LENVLLDVEENVSCEIISGSVSSFEVKGVVYMTINDPKKNNPKLSLSMQPSSGVVFKAHPDIDKKQWRQNKCIMSSDHDEGF